MGGWDNGWRGEEAGGIRTTGQTREGKKEEEEDAKEDSEEWNDES